MKKQTTKKKARIGYTRIHFAMQERGIIDPELALVFGHNDTRTVSNWRRGKNKPARKITKEKLESIFGETCEQLFTFKKTK